LIADTLVTQGAPAPADRPATSTGEPHRQVGENKFVHERLLKFRALKAGIAVAIAGDVQLALGITDFMEDHVGTVESAADLLPKVEASFGPFDPRRQVQLLIIQGTRDGGTAITKWDTQGGRDDTAHYAYIGSMPTEQAERMADLFRRLIADRQPSKRAMLLAGMAFVQSLSKHEDLIEKYVGGVVCGLRVQRARTIWPGDLVIVHHRDDMTSVDGRISVHAREGIVCLNSTYHGRIGTVLVNKHETVHMGKLQQAWSKRWVPYLKDYLSKHFTTCVRWLFINLDRQAPLVFVVHGRLDRASKHLRITKRPRGGYDFTFDSELAEMLQRRAPSDAPDLRILEAIDPSQPLPNGMVQK